MLIVHSRKILSSQKVAAHVRTQKNHRKAHGYRKSLWGRSFRARTVRCAKSAIWAKVPLRELELDANEGARLAAREGETRGIDITEVSVEMKTTARGWMWQDGYFYNS